MDDFHFALAGANCPPASIDALLDEQSCCWRRGERPLAEVFLERRTAPDSDGALELICHEILLRVHCGERPTPEEYARRFPQYAEQLQAHFEVHEVVFRHTRLAGTYVYGAGQADAEIPSVEGYEILGELGRGGNGVVYRARRSGLNRITALKVLRGGPAADPREAARLRGEALALARIGHPNIIQIYEFGEASGQPYLALEFAPGGSLEARLRGGRQPAHTAAALVANLGRAVHAAHRVGVVHRDLKPGNVLFAEDGTPKIADFGLAKRLNAGDAQTRTGDILGTPCYMAPEQIHGGPVGPPADVYALGAILYELLTGRPPFQGVTLWATLAQVIERDPVPPRQVAPQTPRDLETICLKCLHKDPTQRYGSAEGLADDLARFLACRPIRARPTLAWERAWKWVQRRPGAAAGAVLSLILTAALALAHESDLRTRLARAEREAAVADVDRLLQNVRQKINAGHWSEASDRLHEQAQARLGALWATSRSDLRFVELDEEANRLQKQIDDRLTDAARLHRFRALRQDVGFDATPFAGSSAGDRLRRIRASVGEALRLFDAASERGTQLELATSHLTVAERQEIRQGCCELLLEWADAEAAASNGGAGRIAALLNLADSLGVRTSLVASRRAGKLANGPLPALTFGFEWFLRGNDLCSAGRLAEGREAYQKALRAQDDHFGARYALGVCYLKDRPQADVRKAHLLLAREHLTRCIQEHADRVWPYLQRALAADELGDATAAEADYNTAERLLRTRPDPTTLYALHVNRGVGRIQRHDPAGAIPDLTTAAALKPDELPAYFDLAKAYQDLEQLPKAREQLDRAAERARPDAQANVFRSLAQIYEDQDDWLAAARSLEQAVRREPAGASSPAAAADLRCMSKLLLKGGQVEEALRAADAALAATSNDPAAHRVRAEALLRLDRYGEAVEALNRYVDGERRAGRRPESRVYRARAQAAATVGNHAAAAEDFGRALDEDDRQNAAADHASRGWCYVMLKVLPLALRDFEQTIRLDPENSDGYAGRGYVLAKNGRIREAVRDAERVLQLGLNEPRTFYNAARIFALASAGTDEDGSSERIKQRRWQERAVGLLREAMEALPKTQRSDFWHRSLEPDAALNAVRATSAFRSLAASCSASSP
jgi:tetratricopeptide (TPR) repeat protein